jgi:hypothetical protein
MDMRFVTWNVRSHYWAGALKTAASKAIKYNLDPVADGLRVVVSQQMIIHFPMERRMLIITHRQTFSYTKEPHQQLRGQNLFVVGCHIKH